MGSGGIEAGGGMGGLGGLPQIEGIDYLKSSFPRVDDDFGRSVALSADGRTLAVGVMFDSSAAIGINGDPSIEGPSRAGAVFVFWHDGSQWTQQAYIKVGSPDEDDYFGKSVSLSADGNRLAVGAYGEDSSSTGTLGDPLDNGASYAGAAFLFGRIGSSWILEEYVKASNTQAGDYFGWAVALSADGSTLAVGATGEDGATTGVNGDQSSNGLPSSGAVYVFFDSGAGFGQEAYLKASNADLSDYFGGSLALSEDGSTLVVGAEGEDSAAAGMDGAEADDSLLEAGAAYVFSRSGSDWAQTAYLKASSSHADDRFGLSVAISPFGDTIAIGAPSEGSWSAGVNGDQFPVTDSSVGAVYVFSSASSIWEQEAYIKASNPQSNAAFGLGLALSGDGDLLLVGASQESSAAAGIDGNQNDESVSSAGAAYLFSRDASGWLQTVYLKAINPHELAYFGYSVALDEVGETAVVCANSESGSSPGINGDPFDLSTASSGAAYVFYGLD